MRLTFICLLTIIICTSFLQGCSYPSSPKAGVTIPNEMLRDGDIVFRQGIGLASHIVRVADGRGTYSHVGIVTRGKNGWQVIHAVPGEPEYEGEADKVKAEYIADFFSPEKAACGAVMRVDVDSMVAVKASKHAYDIYLRNTLFDHQYDMNDTTQMYCTELVWFVYQKENVSLVRSIDSLYVLPLIDKACLLPDDIADDPHLVQVIVFEY